RADADRIEERLELRDAGLLLLAVLVERRPEELQAVRAEGPEERALRELRVRDRAQEEQDVDREGHDDVPDAQVGEDREADEAEDRVEGRGGKGPNVPRVRGGGQDDRADPEDRPISEDHGAVDPKRVRR